MNNADQMTLAIEAHRAPALRALIGSAVNVSDTAKIWQLIALAAWSS
jgi:hypothetical protein